MTDSPAPPETGPSSSSARTDRRPAVVVLSALTALLLLASVVLVLVVRAQRDSRSDVESARSGALQAGRQAIVNLDALSAATIDADLARVVTGATGQFKKQFVAAQSDLKNLVVQRKTVSSGTILSAGIVQLDATLDAATVLIAVDRLVKDSTNPEGVTARDRWKVGLERRDGRWLVANLDAVA